MRSIYAKIFAPTMAVATFFFVGSEARAADNIKPGDIQKIFVVGKPFSAKAPTGKVVMITLNPDGTAKAVPEGKKKGTKGSWRLSDTGYCSTWAKGSEHCYTVRPQGDGYDVMNKSGIVVAHWGKP